MKNKIMFVCQYFYPEKVSSGVLPYEMASKMSEAGFEVSALVGYPKEYATNNDEVSFMETTDKGVKIKRLILKNTKDTTKEVIKEEGE